MKKIVYCSGPLFCPEEIAGMASIAKVLEDGGFETFLPHRDGIERFVMGLVNTPLNINVLGIREQIDRAVFALDVYQLAQRCDCLVLNMNGRVPDEGAVAEAGMAFASGKPVVIYKNDARTIFKGRDNSMITGLSESPLVRDLNRLPDSVVGAISETVKSPALQGRISTAAALGERIWSILKHFPKAKTGSKDVENLLREISSIPRLSNG